MNPLMPEFQVVLSDNTTFTGQSFGEDWNKIPELPIKKLSYSYAGVSVTFENYLEYNHLIEHAIIVNNSKTISKILIMARLENSAEVIEYNLRINKAMKKTVAIGQEYKGQIIKGWHKGVVIGQPKYSYGKI